MSKITNNDAREYVMRKEEFRTNNKTMFGELREGNPNKQIPPMYVVYSYGYHFPMYVYDYEACQWLGNSDKYSRTTSKHQSLTRPYTVAKWFNTEDLKHLSYVGLVNAVAQRMS